jgi:UDP-N-acetylmuramoyl-tripeptide--D-alanyl-D-alanine ligase
MRLLTADSSLPGLREGLRDLAIASEGKAHRTFAVLGPVDGAGREELMDLGRYLVRLDISALIVVGEAGSIHAGAVLEGSWGEESRHVDSPEAALELLDDELAPEDVVLVAGLPLVLHALEGAT